MRKKLYEVLLILFLSLLPFLWLSRSQIILGHDSGFWLNPVEHLKNLFYSWNHLLNFGYDWSLFNGFLITQFPETMFTILTGSLQRGQEITFSFWFLMMGLSMYIFINSFFPEKRFSLFRIFSSLFYVFNFFILQAWFIVERAKFSLYAALPLGLLIIIKTLNKEYSLLRGTILFSLLFFFLNGGGSPPNYGAILLVYLISFTYLTLINIKKAGLKEIVHTAKTGLLFVTGFLLLNAYWILPQLNLFVNKYSTSLSSVGGIGGVLDWEKTVDRYVSFINLFRLQGIPDWYSEHSYSNYFLERPFLIFLSFIPIAIILLGIVFNRRFKKNIRNDKFLYLFLFILLFSAILAGGSRPPFGFIYTLLITRVPGFAIFRTAFYKFAPGFWFSIVFLSGYFLNLFLLHVGRMKILRLGLSTIAIVFILGYHFPFFTINFFEWNKPFSTKVELPFWVDEMSSYINNNVGSDSKILLLPPIDDAFKADSYSWGYFSLWPLPAATVNIPVVSNNVDSPGIVDDIYLALEENREDIFLELLGRTRINKILWRDDVLYSDKESTSKNLRILEENLKNFSGVTLEKSIGDWRLYGVNNKDERKLFYSSENLIELRDNKLVFGEVREVLGDLQGKDIIFEDITSNNLDPFVSEKITVSLCQFCIPGQLETLTAGIKMPEVRILPDSKLYPFIVISEQRTFEKFKNIPSSRIDVDLSFASKRLAEMASFLQKKKVVSPDKIFIENIQKYQENIDDAYTQTEALSGETKNFYLVRTLSFLEAHGRFLIAMDKDVDIFEKEYFNQLADFIHAQSEDIKDKIWVSESSQNKKYFFKIEEVGKYDLLIINYFDNPEKILIDSNEISSLENLQIEKGLHELELIYPEPAGFLINGEPKIGREIVLSSEGDPEIFTIEKLDKPVDFLISFEYEILEGSSPTFRIDKGETVEKYKLVVDGRPHKAFFVVSNKDKNDDVSFDFYLGGFRKASRFDVKALKVERFSIPKTFLVKYLDTNKHISPQITFEKINPTFYKVSIKDAVSPFILSFGQGFDEGWKLEAEDKKISRSRHFKINGYANSWLIEKEGDYTLFVRYAPQNIFYIGSIVSLITLFSFVLLLRRP